MAEDKQWQAAYNAVDAFLAPVDRWAACKQHWTVADAEAMLRSGMDVSTVTESVSTRYEWMEHC